jgi:phosphoglycolate phosphatase
MMNRKSIYKNVIWDWNGTLLDDVNNCVNIINSLCYLHNIEQFNLSTYKKVFTFPVIKSYELLGFDTSPEAFDRISQYFHSSYEDLLPSCKLYDGVPSVLRSLKGRGINQFILSAHEQGRLLETVKEYQLDCYFKYISGSDNLHGKGKTDHGLNLIKDQKLKSEETIMIGDTLHDFEVAQKLGIACILFSGGHMSENRLKSSGVPVINEISELLNLL